MFVTFPLINGNYTIIKKSKLLPVHMQLID